MATRRDAGQAAVETVGLMVALVLAVAATTTWLVSATRPPDRPPDVIGHAARPLGFPDSVRYWALPAVPHGQEGADEPIGDALRRAAGRGRVAVSAYLVGRQRFNDAYNRRLRERLLEVLRDPLGDPGLPDADILTPGGLARRALDNVDDARAYVARIRSLPADERSPTLLRDAGTLAADATIEVLQALARRRVAGARRPAPRPPPPPAPDVPSP